MKARYGTVLPGIRKGRKKDGPARMTLNQHFGNSGYKAQVAVDLKRRMIVEQIRQHGISQQRFNIIQALIAVSESGPHIDDPGSGPPRVSAAVGQALSERRFRRLQQRFASLVIEEGPARIQREQMRDVPMARLGFLIGLCPFQDSALFTDLRLWEPSSWAPYFRALCRETR